MTVMAIMPERVLNPVEPLGHKPTDMRATETVALQGDGLRCTHVGGLVTQRLDRIQYALRHDGHDRHAAGAAEVLRVALSHPLACLPTLSVSSMDSAQIARETILRLWPALSRTVAASRCSSSLAI